MQLREASGSILYVSFGLSNIKKQVWKYILETVGDLILILVGCLHQPFMDLILNHQQPRKICYEPAALTLPPGNDVCVLLNCFPNYMVMGNVIAGWIMFRSNRGNIYSPHWTHSEVVGVDGGHRKFRTVAWCIRNTVVRLGNDVCFCESFSNQLYDCCRSVESCGLWAGASMDLTHKSSKCSIR